ncbi:hypothetical protein ABZ371_00845 [Streptomyces sp. NPDC005899]|uniref:hypothetical protein n=1 Tax=Streptomyces sp. NPDC005899 TaxID=3155716 RepID=UPI0033C49D98
MTQQPDTLEADYAAPAAKIGPTSPLDELRAAANVLRARDTWESGELALWLVDTALIHGPEDNGRTCFRDGDTWPCMDVHRAQQVAFAIGYEPPAS